MWKCSHRLSDEERAKARLRTLQNPLRHQGLRTPPFHGSSRGFESWEMPMQVYESKAYHASDERIRKRINLLNSNELSYLTYYALQQSRNKLKN